MDIKIYFNGFDCTDDALELLAEKLSQKRHEKEELWGNKQVAEFFSIHEATVIRWYKEGKLPRRNKQGKWPSSAIKKMAYLKNLP